MHRGRGRRSSPTTGGCDAGIPGDRSDGVAPIHRGGCRQSGGPRRRPRGDAPAHRRPADPARGDRERGAAQPAAAGQRPLGGRGEAQRRVPRLVRARAAGRRQRRRGRARVPAAGVGVGQGLRHGGVAGPDPQGLHRARHAAGVRADHGRQRRLEAGHGEGRHAARADVAPDLGRPDRRQRARRGGVRADQAGVGAGTMSHRKMGGFSPCAEGRAGSGRRL